MRNTLRVPTAQATPNRRDPPEGAPTRAERAAFFQPRDEWFKWIETQLANEQGRRLAREADVSPHTALALAAVIGNSGQSFAQEGIFARQETLAADLAKRLVRAKADVRLVRRGLKLLVKVGALHIETRSGRTNLLVPLLAGIQLYDAAEIASEVRTKASATSDASVHPTPDATVREPRTPASYESTQLAAPRGRDLSSLARPPLPPISASKKRSR